MTFGKNIQALKELLLNEINSTLQDILTDESITYDSLIKGETTSSAKRTKDNAKALAIIKLIEDGEAITEEDKEVLKSYTGNGGTNVGSDDEYYTPPYVAKAVWDMAGELPKGAKILEPSAGTGVFIQNAPKDIELEQVELSKTSAKINELVNDTQVQNIPFEEYAKNTEDNSLDAVVGNVPFGKRKSSLDTNSYFDDVSRIEDYFIIQSLKKVRYGKRVTLILPTGVVNSKNREKVKKKILNYGSFVGAVRLPNKVFSHTGANVAVDIAIFEKHPKDVIDAIRQDALTDGTLKSVIYENDINEQFMHGRYFKEAGKKRVLGVEITTEEFLESRLNNNHTKGLQVLTVDSMEQIREKIAKISKHKLDNTTEYENLKIGGHNIYSDMALKVLHKTDSLIDELSGFLDKDTISKKDITQFRKAFSKLSNEDNKQVLFSKTLFRDNILLLTIATNYHDNDDDARRLYNGLKAINQALFMKDKDAHKILKANNESGKIISSKNNIPKFKCKEKNVHHAKHYNDVIGDAVAKQRLFILGTWDLDNMRELDKTSLDNFQAVTFSSIAYLQKDKLEKDEEGIGYFTSASLDKKDIMNNNDIVLHNEKLYGFTDIFSYGMSYTEALKQATDEPFNTAYGLTQEEFEKKQKSTIERIDSTVKKVSLSQITITHMNVDMLVPKSVMPTVEEWGRVNANALINNRAFQVSKLTDDDFRNIDGRYTFASHSRKDYNPFKLLDEDTKEEILKSVKPLLDYEVTKFSDIRYRDLFPEEVYTKIFTIIQRYREGVVREFDVKLDVFIKQDVAIAKAVKEHINKDLTIGGGGYLAEQSGVIHELKELMSTEWVDKAHTYQNEDINVMSDSLSGVASAGTGLGKSLIMSGIALKALQSGRAKRVLMVAPNGVIQKWEMELLKGREGVAPIIKEDKRDMVQFLDKKTAPKSYANFIKDKSKRILFLTYNQMATLSFRDETQTLLRGDTEKEIEANGGFSNNPSRIPEFKEADWANLFKQASNSIGYFEDANFDLAIYDESQTAKNSATGGGNYKFASSLSGSKAGLVSRAISAYLSDEVHGGRAKGTILVTATPFTNTPYEIFATLKKLGRLKEVKSLKSFENLYMNIVKEPVPMATRPDIEVMKKVFRGLKNIAMLDGLETVSYRTAEKEANKEGSLLDKTNLKPDEDYNEINIEETDSTLATKESILAEYDKAKEYMRDAKNGVNNQSIVDDFALKGISKDNIGTIASPLSVLKKIEKLSTGVDFALDTIKINVSTLTQEEQDTLLLAVEKKEIIYEELEEVIIKGEIEEKKIKKKMTLKEYASEKMMMLLYDNVLTLPTTDSKILAWVLKEIPKDKQGQLFDIEDFPKFAVLLKNIKKELDENKNAKQLIFALSLSGAMIIERFIIDFCEELGISPKEIMSTLSLDVGKGADSKDDTGKLAKFQEKYNNSTIATVLIFTKATSTGVDFNKNTQAIHLIDIPYTPDVEEQAKGRGIRQGNPLKSVRTYKYIMGGTFDFAKQEIMQTKAVWQTRLLDGIGENTSDIENSGVDEDIISKAISLYGVNFTRDQLKGLIEEEEEAQKKIVEEKKAFKVETLKSEINKKLKLVHASLTRGKIVSSLPYPPNPYSETTATWKVEEKKHILSKYKLLISKAKDVGKRMVREYYHVLSDEDIDINTLTKESVEKGVTKVWEEQLTRNNFGFRYPNVYRVLLEDDTLELKYEKMDNPLTVVQREVAKRQISDAIKEQAHAFYAQIVDLLDAEESLKGLALALGETGEEGELVDKISKLGNGAVLVEKYSTITIENIEDVGFLSSSSSYSVEVFIQTDNLAIEVDSRGGTVGVEEVKDGIIDGFGKIDRNGYGVLSDEQRDIAERIKNKTLFTSDIVSMGTRAIQLLKDNGFTIN